MFVFSNIQDYDGDPAVKEILVFSDELEKNSYNPVPEDSSQHNTCTYKLKAVLRSDKTWEAVIRKGNGGYLLYDSYESYATFEAALNHAFDKLLETIKENVELYRSVIPTTVPQKNIVEDEKVLREKEFWNIATELLKKGLRTFSYSMSEDIIILKIDIYHEEYADVNALFLAYNKNNGNIQFMNTHEGISNIWNMMQSWEHFESFDKFTDLIKKQPIEKLNFSAKQLFS